MEKAAPKRPALEALDPAKQDARRVGVGHVHA